MEIELENLSREDFDREIKRQVAEVGRLRGATREAERKLAWLREGRNLYFGPEPEVESDLKLIGQEEHANGKRPESLTEAIERTLAGRDRMRSADIIGTMLAQRWITEADRHTASSMLSNMTSRGQLERVDRGVYKLAPPKGSEEP